MRFLNRLESNVSLHNCRHYGEDHFQLSPQQLLHTFHYFHKSLLTKLQLLLLDGYTLQKMQFQFALSLLFHMCMPNK